MLKHQLIGDYSSHFQPIRKGRPVFTISDAACGSCLSVQPERSWGSEETVEKEEGLMTLPTHYQDSSGVLFYEPFGPLGVIAPVPIDTKKRRLSDDLEYVVWDATNGFLVSCGRQEAASQDNRVSLVSMSPSGSYLPHQLAPVDDISDYLASAFEQIETAPSDYIRLLDEIGEFAKLENNWNGEGALSIDGGTSSNAKRLLRAVQTSGFWEWPSIGPMPDGRYSFTWECGEKELWVYVSAAGYTSHKWDSKEQFKGSVGSFQDPRAIAELIEWLKK